jgi:hypothetical protein
VTRYAGSPIISDSGRIAAARLLRADTPVLRVHLADRRTVIVPSAEFGWYQIGLE